MFSLRKGLAHFLLAKNNGETYTNKYFSSQKTDFIFQICTWRVTKHYAYSPLLLSCVHYFNEEIHRNIFAWRVTETYAYSPFKWILSAVLFTCTGWSDRCTARCSVNCTHLYWWSSRRMCTARCSALRINHEKTPIISLCFFFSWENINFFF